MDPVRVLDRNERGMVTAVELDVYEMGVRDWFDEHLDTEPGTHGIEECARAALAAMPLPHLTAEFVEWLSHGTLTVITAEAFTDPVVVRADDE